MSGMVGMYGLDGKPVSSQELETMADAIAHRGPDGTGFWMDGAVGVGCQMLYTTPESRHESLPHVSEDATLVLTADARLDNREELIGRLEPPVRRDRPVTDGELILAAYRKWGAACAEHLLGDFAFALWDRVNRRLVCARDPFGVRPFYYYFEPGRRFVFASEIKCLMGVRNVPDALNEVEIGRRFYLPLAVDASSTCYQHIHALDPAHVLTVDRSGISKHRYWDFDPDREIVLGSDDEYAEAFRELFVRAVHARIRSAFPVGTMLSGGLDSSSITCAAAAKKDRPVMHTFSAVFDDVPASDEQPFIESVLQMYPGLSSHFLYADAVDPTADLSDIQYGQEGPTIGNVYVNWHAYRMAGANGVRVVLDGFDGDNVVSHGLGYLSELAHARRFFKLSVEVRAYAMAIGEPWGPAVRAWLAKYLFAPMLRKAGLRLPGRRGSSLRLPTDSSPDVPAWAAGLNPDFAARLAPHLDRSAAARSQREDQIRALRRAVGHGVCEGLNKSGAAFGVEPTFPFFDRPLVEFCLALPPEQKLRQGLTRLVLRNGMRGILPATVRLRRDKSNLEHGLIHGVRTFALDEIGAVIGRKDARLDRFVDRASLQSIFENFLNERESIRERTFLLNAFALGSWLQRESSSRYAVSTATRSRAV